jgi:hypothetical protein
MLAMVPERVEMELLKMAELGLLESSMPKPVVPVVR